MEFLTKKKKWLEGLQVHFCILNVWRLYSPDSGSILVKPFSKIGKNSQIKELFIEDLLGGRHLSPLLLISDMRVRLQCAQTTDEETEVSGGGGARWSLLLW